MPRFSPGPAPDRRALLSYPLHVIVRRYPETLSVLRRVGVDPAASGGVPLGSVAGGEDVVERLLERTGWRPSAEAPEEGEA